MSSICGTVDLSARALHFDRLKAMAGALCLRGAEQSGAYINGGVGLQHNRLIINEPQAERQPLTLRKDERDLTILLDGRLSNKKALSERLSLTENASSARIVLEAYIAFGLEALSLIDGVFALAIYDHTRKELILARDKRGAKPLYYTTEGSTLIFASEIKALLSVSAECLEVERAAVSELILSDVGEISGVDLYRNVNELPSSSFAVFSRLGLQISAYKAASDTPHTPCLPTVTLTRTADSPSLEDALSLSLFAHDYPAFDEHILAYITALSSSSGEIYLEDPIVAQSADYAFERADRLGSLYSLLVHPIPPSSPPPYLRKKEAAETEKKLTDLVGKLFAKDPFPMRLLDEKTFERVTREKDITRRIRSLGMILQAGLWVQRYPIIPL